jgi:hypothetical protein
LNEVETVVDRDLIMKAAAWMQARGWKEKLARRGQYKYCVFGARPYRGMM